jgi:hypothetical protein
VADADVALELDAGIVRCYTGLAWLQNIVPHSGTAVKHRDA